MAIYIGDTATDTLVLPGIAGETFVTDFSSGPAGAWSPTRTEPSPGVYVATKGVTAAGTWTWVGTSTPSGIPWVIDWDVDAAPVLVAPSVVAPGVAALPDVEAVLYAGDDYRTTEGRQLVWSFTLPYTLTGATVRVRLTAGAQIVDLTGVVSGAFPAAQTVTVEPTRVQTATLLPGYYDLDIQATLANLDVVTLRRGRVKIISDR